MSLDRIHSSKGFTLIEVLIALVVAVVGILAMIQLSGAFLQTTSESDQRTVAYALAERTLEDLRGFDSLNGSTAGQTYFDDIISSTTASVTVSSGQSTYVFDIDWVVTDNIVSGAVITPSVSGASYRKLKEVEVVVSWISPQAGSVSLSSMIAGIDPNAAALTSNDLTDVAGSTPDVNYNPGVAPDVIAIDVTGTKLKETTKPLPDVASKNESTEVKFETITYKNSADNNQLIQEDFLTVNCICTLNANKGTKNGLTPTYQEFSNVTDGLINKLGEAVDSESGTVKSLGGGLSQSEYCGRCCAYHHDNTDENSTGVTYKTGFTPNANHNHPHYDLTGPDPTTDLVLAGDGDDYLEACRFKRVEGIYRLAADWNMIEVNVFPDGYLASGASTGLASYIDYIKDRVQYEIHTEIASLAGSTAQPVLALSRDDTVTNGEAKQALSRTIYLDNFSHDTNLKSYLQGLVADTVASQQWFEFIPFYEINTTLLSRWGPTSNSIATVTSEDIDNVVDAATDYYGTYSRGLIVGGTGVGSAAITTYMKQGNTGILGNTYANPSTLKGEDNRIIPSPTVLSDSITITNGACTDTSCFISGFIKENEGGVDITKTVLAISADRDPGAVNGDGNGVCTIGSLDGGNQYSYSCEVDPVDGTLVWKGTVQVTSSLGSKQYAVEIDADTSTTTGDTASISIVGAAAVNVNFYLEKL